MRFRFRIWLLLFVGVVVLGRYMYQELGMQYYWKHGEAYGQNPASGMEKHFNAGTVTVHKVYPYSGPHSTEPYFYAKAVAVDMEFQNVNKALDLDDLDIIDGSTKENFGSDPDMIGLSLDGKTMLDPDPWPEDMKHFRGLFIYNIRKKTTSVHVGYWGHFITTAPLAVDETAILPVQPMEKDVYFTGTH